MKKLYSMRYLGWIILFTVTVIACSESRSVNEARPLNYIIIFADDLGYGDLGVYGHPTIRTPNLDRMAAEGQKWTNFYVGASVCTPSRAALLTGRLPIRSGMAGAPPNRVLFPDSDHGLPAEEITLAEQLKKAGYATGCIGKWHLGHKEQYLPTQNGFDYYFGIPYSNDMDNLVLQAGDKYQGYMEFWRKAPERHQTETFNVPLMRGNDIIEQPADQNTITRRYSEEAVHFIKEHKEEPFFLYLAHSLPHVPLFASNDFLGKSKRGLYGDAVEEIDHGVGDILETLKKESIEDNTLVVFTSDNGPWLIMELEGGSAGLLKDGKGSTWEGGMREPCIFWSPDRIKPGVISDLGTTMDLFTTFSRLSKVELPSDRIMDGVDLSPVLFEEKPGERQEIFYYRGRELYALRVGAFKAHFITQGAYGAPAKEYHEIPELYNVEIDPSEKFNIAEDNLEIIAKILEIREKHLADLVPGEDQLKFRGGKISE